MKAKHGLALGLMALGLAGPVHAEGWTVTDFSSLPDRATCMNYAETTVNTYRSRFGSDGFTGRSDWTLGGVRSARRGDRRPVHLRR